MLGWYASAGCRGEDVGRLNASCVLEIAVREFRAVFPDENRFVNQLIAGGRRAVGETRETMSNGEGWVAEC